MTISTMLIKKQILIFLVICGAISSLYYFSWWFEPNRLKNPVFLVFLFVAVIYYLIRVFSVWYIYLYIKHPETVEAPVDLTVDVFIPTHDEPLWLVERTLKAAIAMRYPHSTYLIDDGRKVEYRKLAEHTRAHSLSRPSNEDNKAGNINNALVHSKGEFVAILDVDHVPKPNFLDRSSGYFRVAKAGLSDYVKSLHQGLPFK